MSRLRERKRTVIYDVEETSEIEDSDIEAKVSKRPRQVNSSAINTRADEGPGQPQEGPKKRVLTRLVKKKHQDTPEVSDEIEYSEAEQSDEIAEISESEGHEVMKRPKEKEKRRGMASILKDGARGGKNSKKSVAAMAEHLNMTNSMLKYTRPNVSNVQEKSRGRSKEDGQEDADKTVKEEPREGRRPRRAAAASVNYNEEVIANQAFLFAAADNGRKAHQANEKSKETKKGADVKAEDRVTVPDSEDECEEIVTELCTTGAKVGRGSEKESENAKGETTRRSARQRGRVSYAEVEEGIEFENFEAPARVLRKQAMEALSKRKEVEDEGKAKKRTISDLNQFVFQKGAAETGGAEDEDGEGRATKRGNGRALRDRTERNLNRSSRGRSRKSSPESDAHSSESEEERPRKKKSKHTSPVRKSERVRKPVKTSLAEDDSDEDEPDSDEETGDEEDEVAASGEDDGEEAEASDAEDELDGRVEKILAPAKGSIDVENRRFVVKFHERSYRAAKAVSESVLMQHCSQLLRNYLVKGGEGSEDEPFNPDYAVIDRIIAERHRRGGARELLVKWRGLEYGRATWEAEEDLEDDKDAIERFESLSRKPEPHPNDGKESGELEFKTGRTLRDYQLVGVRWLAQNYQGKRSCMLGDEMGLGKTFQTVAMLETLHRRGKAGPFLVVAPVSTLGHWQREVESLTDLYCVVYKGDANDRNTIRTYEFGSARSRKHRFHVLLTSFELLVKDATHLKNIPWRYVVVDEAHRLKGRNSLASKIIRNMDLRAGELLLLTGTPIQNNTSELYALLSLLDPEKYDSEEEFLEKFGNIKDSARVRELQEQLKHILLRRKKEDVEKSIPQKEEVIIWVELTQSQRSYYKAVYEGQIGTLLKGVKKGNLPNMRNVAMELRKLCNHPFLSNSVADNMIQCRRWEARGQLDHLSDEALRSQLLQQGSGKMVLLNKLLPKLRDGGHKVLIFSQFKIMLDLLEDYINEKGYPFERIDGDITGSGRQAAMDRFQAEGSDSFIFLLSTRAGGLGITLTAADTCIIYDSDWNPQNDLQAMARCHRIGQTKDVKVYRLVTKNTYEEQLFQSASRKYGLDEAILGDDMGDQRDPEQGKDIENLLLKGAYHCLQDEAAEQAAASFGEEDIEQILMQRTETRQVGGAGKSSFAEATFAPVEEEMKWEALLPEAVALEREREEAAARALVEGIKHPRRRNQVNYTEKAAYASSDSDEDFDGSEEGRPARKSSPKETGWTDAELKRLEEKLLSLGEGRWVEIQTEARLTSKPLADVTAVCSALIELCKHAAAAPKPAPLVAATAQTPEAPVPIVGLAAPIGDPPAGSGPPAVAPVPAPAAAAPFKTAIKLDVPGDARKAFDAGKFRERIGKNAQKYLQFLHERTALASAVADNDSLTKWLITNHKFVPGRNKLPQWWDWQCDKDLMVGAHRLGHKAFRAMTEDQTLRFRSLLAIRDPNPDALRTAPPLQPASLSPFAGPSLSPGTTPLAPVALPTSSPSSPKTPVPAFLPREMPSDQILTSRLKKLIAQHPVSRSKADVAEEAARKARAAAAREERARAQAALAASPGQSSGEDSDGARYTALVARRIEREAEKNIRKAERKAARKRQRKEEAARELAQTKARRAADVAVGEKRRAEQPAESPKKVAREGEQQKSPRQPPTGNGAKSAGQKSTPKKPTASADFEGKLNGPLASACLVLGSPEKRKSSPGKGQKGGKSPLPVRPALSPSAANASSKSPAKPTGQSGAGSDAKPAAGGSGKSSPGGLASFQGPSKAATHRPKEAAPGGAAKPRPAGVTQVLSKQGAPKRTSSEGGSVEVVRSADFEKAKKKRQREDGALGGSGLGSGSQGGGKSGKVQPVPDKENQQPSKKKKKHKFDRTDVKQQTLMTFMRAKPTPAVV